jgi:ABC-2 type transport system ATP-binding protein
MESTYSGMTGVRSPDTDAIVIEDIVMRFEDIVAVDHLNLIIKKGELFALLGPNGAGKTTTIKVLCGLLEPTSGHVMVGGFDVRKHLDKIKGLIGVCPQEASVFPYLTGRENIEFFGELHGMSKTKLKARVALLLKKLFLEEHANRAVQKYSGGLVRRASIAMALVQDPDITFLDEPTVAMDPQSRRAVWDFIKDLKDHGKTVILTTHNMDEAEQLADRIGIIDHGKLIALGTPESLKADNKCKNIEELFLKLTGRQIREEN